VSSVHTMFLLKTAGHHRRRNGCSINEVFYSVNRRVVFTLYRYLP